MSDEERAREIAGPCGWADSHHNLCSRNLQRAGCSACNRAWAIEGALAEARAEGRKEALPEDARERVARALRETEVSIPPQHRGPIEAWFPRADAVLAALGAK